MRIVFIYVCVNVAVKLLHAMIDCTRRYVDIQPWASIIGWTGGQVPPLFGVGRRPCIQHRTFKGFIVSFIFHATAVTPKERQRYYCYFIVICCYLFVMILRYIVVKVTKVCRIGSNLL